MHEAVNYVNDMKKKIGEMQKRREELRKVCNVATTSVDPNTDAGVSPHHSVKINLMRDGMGS